MYKKILFFGVVLSSEPMKVDIQALKDDLTSFPYISSIVPGSPKDFQRAFDESVKTLLLPILEEALLKQRAISCNSLDGGAYHVQIDGEINHYFYPSVFTVNSE